MRCLVACSLLFLATVGFGYDNADQLTSESRTGYSAVYAYDGNGNRTSRTVNGSSETYSYDSCDRLTGITGGTNPRTFGYDLAGRLTGVTTSAGSTTVSYDALGQATAITGPGLTASFSYNGLGSRAAKTENGVSRTFLRDGAYVTDPVLKDGVMTFNPGISLTQGSTTKYQHAGIKNIDVQSTASQTLGATVQRSAFGDVATVSGTLSGPFGYGGGYGYQTDSNTGLLLLGHRLYDPSAGRFLTRDPVKDGRNWYGYCGGSPTNSADPEGYQFAPLPAVAPGLLEGAGAVATGGTTGCLLPIAGAAAGGWMVGRWIDEATGISTKLGNWIGGNRDYIPADPRGLNSPRNGKGGFNKGRGDDPAYRWDERTLLAAISDAKNSGDTKRVKQLQRIWKERFRGRRGGT